MALSDSQRRRFFDRGILRIPSAFSERDAARMVDRIWDLLEAKSAIRRGDPATWTIRRPTGFQSLTRTGAFNSIAGPPIVDALNDLFGSGWEKEASGN